MLRERTLPTKALGSSGYRAPSLAAADLSTARSSAQLCRANQHSDALSSPLLGPRSRFKVKTSEPDLFHGLSINARSAGHQAGAMCFRSDSASCSFSSFGGGMRWLSPTEDRDLGKRERPIMNIPAVFTVHHAFVTRASFAFPSLYIRRLPLSAAIGRGSRQVVKKEMSGVAQI
jgi:hypothetical protein